jgi:hypothetical protein
MKKILSLTPISNILLIAFLVAGVVCSLGCKKLVEVSPPDNSIAQENAYNDDITAAAVLTALYSKISGVATTAYGLPSISKLAGLSADEFALWTGADAAHAAYYKNGLIAPVSVTEVKAGHELWNACYPLIYSCNSAIQGLTASKSLTPAVREQLLGEARFMRSFIYFYLVNLYGNLPLAIGIDPEVNRLLPRSQQSVIYDLIIDDLNQAKDLLSGIYLAANMVSYPSGVPSERVRPTKWAASALLARVYLFKKDFVKAEVEATTVINNSNLFNLITLTNVFLKNSNEAIWQLQPVFTGWNTEDARMFNLAAVPAGFSSSKVVYLSNSLLSAFEPGDNRRSVWVDGYLTGGTTYYYPNKYKQAIQDATITSSAKMTEYRMMLRLAEQYLIRAEARAQQNNIAGAIADINTIRSRARANPSVTIPNPLPDLQATLTQSQVLDAVLKERRIELFSELGHRWFDLKRTGKVDEVMTVETPLKGGLSWQTYQQLYPIPYQDISRDPNLVQNTGY